GAPVGGGTRRVAYHVAGGVDLRRLVVLGVHTGVADARRGLHHHVPVVGRIGQGLLVAGPPGGGHRPAGPPPHRAERLAAEGPSVLQHQDRFPAHRRAFPSSTVGSPRRNVATTRPGSVIPAYGVLRLRLASSLGATVHCAAGSTRVRLAGAPGAGSWPCSASPAIRAGARL